MKTPHGGRKALLFLYLYAFLLSSDVKNNCVSATTQNVGPPKRPCAQTAHRPGKISIASNTCAAWEIAVLACHSSILARHGVVTVSFLMISVNQALLS